ncbi:MAG: hypothetical protein ACXW3Z_11390 [Limisphaerales bacterium]
MMSVLVAGSDFKVQNLSKRIAEVKTLKKTDPPFTPLMRGETSLDFAQKIEFPQRMSYLSNASE